MPDAGLRSLLHTHLRAGFHWQAVETGLTAAGVPDTNFCSGGVEGWVECKATREWAVTLIPEQVGWLTTRARRGGRVFIAVRRVASAGPRKGPAADELWLIRGALAREAREGGLRGLPPSALLGVWPGGPGAWDWPRVSALLLG